MARSRLTIGLGAALIVSIGLNIASWDRPAADASQL